jgi:hypothetical protein
MSIFEIYDYELPVPVRDLERVARILRDHDVFRPGPTAGDIYSWRACRKSHADGVTVVALLDRNVLNDVVSLASTATSDFAVPLSARARFGAAVMAYLLCCNILVDPGLAVYEWPSDALDKLTLFRRADEADAAVYVDIALERADRLAPADLPPPKIQPTPETVRGNVSGREEHHLAVLKIAELERAPLTGEERIWNFLDWTFNNYIFLPAAISLAIQQFAPRRSKPILRRVSIADRQRALSAVNNAVWDLTVAMHWAERATKQLEEKKFWVLCSRDAALKALAKNLHFSGDAGQTQEGAIRQMCGDLWGPKDGSRLADRLLALMIDAQNPSRWCNQSGFDDRIATMSGELEQQFLVWQPI